MTEHPPTTPTAVDDLLELLPSWQRDMRVEKCSERTLKTYRESVQAFAAHLSRMADPPAGLEDITGDHIKDWVLALRKAGKADSTISTRFANVRAFFNWLVAEGELERSPMAGLKQPRAELRPVAVVPVEVLRAMLDGCGSDFEGRRDEALIRVLADGGMRIDECMSLTVDDVDMDQQVFWVRGKGDRLRAVPFGMRTARAVDRYLRARRRHPKVKDYPAALWLGRVGPIKPDAVAKMLARRAVRAGHDPIHPHQLRHTAAHQLRLAGMNDQDMKRIFGWRSGRMLERYGASAADERAREAHRRLSFGDRI